METASSSLPDRDDFLRPAPPSTEHCGLGGGARRPKRSSSIFLALLTDSSQTDTLLSKTPGICSELVIVDFDRGMAATVVSSDSSGVGAMLCDPIIEMLR